MSNRYYWPYGLVIFEPEVLGPKHTCFLGDGEEVCEDDDELVNDGEWRGESQLELEEESHEDDDPTKPPPNCWRADVITSKNKIIIWQSIIG